MVFGALLVDTLPLAICILAELGLVSGAARVMSSETLVSAPASLHMTSSFGSQYTLSRPYKHELQAMQCKFDSQVQLDYQG